MRSVLQDLHIALEECRGCARRVSSAAWLVPAGRDRRMNDTLYVTGHGRRGTAGVAFWDETLANYSIGRIGRA